MPVAERDWVEGGGTGIYFTALIGRNVVSGCVNIDAVRDKIIQLIASEGSDQQQQSSLFWIF